MKRAPVWWLLSAVLWLVLTRGSVRDWGLGLAFVTGAMLVAMRLAPREHRRFSLLGLARFVPFFLGLSIVGGVDVALRALRGPASLAPALRRYPVRLEENCPALLFFASVISLIPGTLCVELEERALLLHIVDERRDPSPNLRRLEELAAGLFKEPLLQQGAA